MWPGNGTKFHESPYGCDEPPPPANMVCFGKIYSEHHREAQSSLATVFAFNLAQFHYSRITKIPELAS